MRHIVITIFFLALTSCASLKQEPPIPSQPAAIPWGDRVGVLSNIEDWDLKGLIAIRNSRHAWNAHWQWQQNHTHYSIALVGPLGSGSLQLTGSPKSVLLETSDGKKITSTSPEALLEQQMGWRLPVSDLYYWVRGLPVPNLSAQKQFDAAHRLSVLIQNGWRIEYSRYVLINHVDLPDKMILNNPELNVKIIINEWKM